MVCVGSIINEYDCITYFLPSGLVSSNTGDPALNWNSVLRFTVRSA